MVTRRDYTAEAVEAAHSVLVELTHLLGEYRNSMVLVGGWVPDFLFPGVDPPHVGSMDIDLAMDHTKITESGYETISNLLAGRGYEPGDQPYSFFRTITVKGADIRVEVDILAGEYVGSGRRRRHQSVQDIKARKVRGCDLAFDMYREISVTGILPGGGKDTVTIRVASVIPFLVMKGMALADRVKEKDAWDVYYCLRNYPGGLDALVQEFRIHKDNKLVKEGLEKIGSRFESVDHAGPQWVADFDEIEDPEDRELLTRDAFERVNYFLLNLQIRR